nr:Uncharacterised protein [Escherichia coli]
MGQAEPIKPQRLTPVTAPVDILSLSGLSWRLHAAMRHQWVLQYSVPIFCCQKSFREYAFRNR